MDKLTPEQIEVIFKNYKENMIWILLGFSFISLLIQHFQNLSLSKKIEKYKNELAKNEIKFTRHTELQVECLKKMYDILVSLHFSFSRLINPNYFSHNSFKNNIKNMNFFHRNKILLTKDMITQIGVVHTKIKKVIELCDSEMNNLSELEESYGTEDVQIIYQNPEEEISSVKKRIERLNENSNVNTLETDIKMLRELVEKYFKKLVI